MSQTHVKRMLRGVMRRGDVLACGSCMDARGLAERDLVEGARRSTMDELARRTLESDRVLVF